MLDTLIPKEVEVQTKAGAWYLLRIQPYRTLENVIEGAVITFVEITEMKKCAGGAAGIRGPRRLAVVVRDRTMPSCCRTWRAVSWPGTRGRRGCTAGAKPRRWR